MFFCWLLHSLVKQYVKALMLHVIVHLLSWVLKSQPPTAVFPLIADLSPLNLA
jgi:hypothetical protein